MTAPMLPWLAAARAAADRPPARPRAPWLVDGAVCGSLEPALAQRLVDAGLPIRAGAAAWHLDAPAEPALAAIAGWLRWQGLAAPWRDELLAVTDAAGQVIGRVERAVVRVLGVTTFAVHLVGRAERGGWWVQQRAHDKATDPGLWDTLMGGQVAAGESTRVALERETLEEAGLDVAALHGLHQGERLTVRRPVAEGYMLEHIEVFAATVPEALVPRNLDGEVERFECIGATELAARLARGAFTLEASLILSAEPGLRAAR